ncbi:GNAT family N-acetyltransferase [Marinicauda salina]|uniref:GNAT family N-acetyltransferase n=1 Tax=Marinicauda salina TaxID=2135793 RepID=UPI0022B87C4C|nr:GNAT family N-acetyltransferase [Marinicauda salina]
MRGHRADDLEACFAIWGDPGMTRHIGGRPSTRSETWTRLNRYLGHWALMGYGYWLVEARDTGAAVGEVGLAEFKRDIDPPIEGTPEAGWVIAPAHQRKGYAREAMDAVLAWADETLGAARTCCLIAPENAVSIRLAASLGYREAVRTFMREAATVVFFREKGGAP